MEGSSGDAFQRARLDDPQASPDDPRRRLEENMGCAIEDYERAIAARSRGLVRGRTAWSDGRECWLVDFPLVVLVVNRMRTPALGHHLLSELPFGRPPGRYLPWVVSEPNLTRGVQNCTPLAKFPRLQGDLGCSASSFLAPFGTFLFVQNRHKINNVPNGV